MSLFFWIIAFSLLGGVLSVTAAAIFLTIPDRFRQALIPHFISFATGALLGAAFLALLPHAVTGKNAIEFHQLGLTILLGILAFFLLEKMVLWRHCHEHDCEAHTLSDHHREKVAGTLVLIGDATHNLVDGILIGAAFITDFHLGVVTSLAVAAHEIPQEVGDFAILLNSGFERGKAFLFNVLASITTVIGAAIAYFSLQETQQVVPYILAIAASSFIYIAVADLIPGLHKRVEITETIRQVVLIVAGVAVIYFTHATLH